MKIEIPKNCPSCNSLLHLVNGQLFCPSNTCPAKDSKLLEKFCKIHSLKGFGPATIKKLQVQDIKSILSLTEETLCNVLGNTVGPKLCSELNRLKEGVELPTLLTSLSIPTIGAVKAEKIAASSSEISFESLINSAKIANIGNVSYNNFVDWLSNDNNYNLLVSFNIKTKDKKTDTANSIDICITGALLDFKSRQLATDYLAQFGFNVKNSITKTVKYLVCEDDKKSNSSSYKKALELDIPILTINELINIHKGK